MTDSEYKAEKKRVMKSITKWKHILGLGAHKINIEWDRHTKESNPDVAIDCNNSWQYRLICLNVYTPVTVENSDDELEHIVIHELSHTLLAPLAQSVDDEENVHEFATTCVAQAIQWAYEAGSKVAK